MRLAAITSLVNLMIRWIAWAVFAVIWTTLLVLPGSNFRPLGLDNTPLLRFILAKSLHMLAYTLFTFLSGLLPVPARYRCVVLFFVVVHGTATELIQLHFVENRSGTLDDVGIDNLGVLLGLLAGWKWWTDPK
jgi:hypothetical protein